VHTASNEVVKHDPTRPQRNLGLQETVYQKAGLRQNQELGRQARPESCGLGAALGSDVHDLEHDHPKRVPWDPLPAQLTLDMGAGSDTMGTPARSAGGANAGAAGDD
jgi:hypothetical protein